MRRVFQSLSREQFQPHRGSGAPLCAQISAWFWLCVRAEFFAGREGRFPWIHPAWDLRCNFLTAAERNGRSLPSTVTLFSHLYALVSQIQGQKCDSCRSHVCALPAAIPAGPGRGGSAACWKLPSGCHCG